MSIDKAGWPAAARAANPSRTTMCRASASFNRQAASAVVQNLRPDSRIAAATCCGDSGANSPANSAATLFQAISGRP
jgi:hypothetical protein